MNWNFFRGGGSKLLKVKCFGNFEVYSNGAPLIFKRTKTKELLAFLIDRNGAGVTTKQICAKLWENNTDDLKNMNYLYQLIKDLTCALKGAGAEGVLVKKSHTYAIDPKKLDCDYYNYLEKGRPKFFGEYMSQYSWAESTCALLLENRIE